MGSREEEDMNSWSSHLFIQVVRPVGDPPRQVLELINLLQMAQTSTSKLYLSPSSLKTYSFFLFKHMLVSNFAG